MPRRTFDWGRPAPKKKNERGTLVKLRYRVMRDFFIQTSKATKVVSAGRGKGWAQEEIITNFSANRYYYEYLSSTRDELSEITKYLVTNGFITINKIWKYL